MRSKYLLVIILLFISFTANAQTKHTISGYVKDSLTAESLIGVAVSSTETNYTYTNEYGFYSLTVDNKDVNLSFSCISYDNKEHKVSIDSDFNLNIVLTPAVLVLDEINVVSKNENLVATRELGNFVVSSKQLDYVGIVNFFPPFLLCGQS